MSNELKPGNGWEQLSHSVWEHTSGARIHVMGVIRLPDGTCLALNHRQGGILGRKLIQVNGGNRKRGLMAWAVSIIHGGERR